MLNRENNSKINEATSYTLVYDKVSSECKRCMQSIIVILNANISDRKTVARVCNSCPYLLIN